MIRMTAGTAIVLTEMKSSLEEIVTLIGDLTEKLDVLEVNWDGEAREAYALAQRQWNESMARLTALATSARGRAQRHAEDISGFDSRRSSAWVR